MALIEDFDNLAKNYLTPKRDSFTEKETSINNDGYSPDSYDEDIVVVSPDGLNSATQILSNNSESLIPEIELPIGIDLVPGVLDVIIDEPPIDEPPLDGLFPLYGDIDLEIYTNNGDNDIIKGDTGDINFDDENTDYLA